MSIIKGFYAGITAHDMKNIHPKSAPLSHRKKILPFLFGIGLVFTIVLISTHLLYAEDMRKASIIAEKELKEALTMEKKSNIKINETRNSLIAQIDKEESTNRTLRERIDLVGAEIAALQHTNETLASESSEDKASMEELAGAVRSAAGNLKALLSASTFTARLPERLDQLAPVLDSKRFPGIDDMKILSDLFLEETDFTGDVELNRGEYVSDTGEKATGTILTLGGFTAAYMDDKAAGFLNYSEESRKLHALSALPSWFIQKNLKAYMKGESDSVYIDISRGGALRQITHKQSLADRIKKGGLLVWPILALGVLALFIALERTLFLGRVHANTDRVMGKVNELAARGEWDTCDRMVNGEKKIPVYNVLRSGLGARNENRETLESILQESILKELPRLERFLPMLNIMGAIAPLLGLLGTVTGMISTFHVITLYGTGDPRMMSGGISTALVTTMLGLSVAIPIMLLYTFLCRRVEHVVGDMEEKAVALTNIIFREAR